MNVSGVFSDNSSVVNGLYDDWLRRSRDLFHYFLHNNFFLNHYLGLLLRNFCWSQLRQDDSSFSRVGRLWNSHWLHLNRFDEDRLLNDLGGWHFHRHRNFHWNSNVFLVVHGNWHLSDRLNINHRLLCWSFHRNNSRRLSVNWSHRSNILLGGVHRLRRCNVVCGCCVGWLPNCSWGNN